MSPRAPHILIAGGGVAAIEAVAALRALTGPRLRISVLAPEDELVPRPASVASPFGFGPPNPLPFAAIQRHAPFHLLRGKLARVIPEEHLALDDDDEPIPYDRLLVAVGARPQPAVPGAITFAGPGDARVVERAVQDARRLAFVLPSVSTWSLPVYELAILAAAELRGSGVTPEITVVTPEPEPLWLFGHEATRAVRELLAERGIALRTRAQAIAAHDGVLELVGEQLPADRVIALPMLAGPALRGLPEGPSWFVPADVHGRVPGVPDVFAAGDATTFPLKQGGLATQQADAAAETIAAEFDAPITPAPFRPVLRGLLLTGGAPLYLRARLTSSGEPAEQTARPVTRRTVTAVSRRALWWPPSKIAGRYLAPLLATARPPLLATSQMQDLSPRPAEEGREDARELAFALAEEDAAVGDYAQAVRAVDAAAALTGGVLPEEWARRRAAWAAGHGAHESPLTER
jgi:sulfide:quinone oxidoreductase